jgi:sensor histidine kinase YesM
VLSLFAQGQHIITLVQEILKHPQYLTFIRKAKKNQKKNPSLINLEFKPIIVLLNNSLTTLRDKTNCCPNFHSNQLLLCNTISEKKSYVRGNTYYLLLDKISCKCHWTRETNPRWWLILILKYNFLSSNFSFCFVSFVLFLLFLLCVLCVLFLFAVFYFGIVLLFMHLLLTLDRNHTYSQTMMYLVCIYVSYLLKSVKHLNDRIISLREKVRAHEPATFYWSACTKSEKWASCICMLEVSILHLSMSLLLDFRTDKRQRDIYCFTFHWYVYWSNTHNLTSK